MSNDTCEALRFVTTHGIPDDPHVEQHDQNKQHQSQQRAGRMPCDNRSRNQNARSKTREERRTPTMPTGGHSDPDPEHAYAEKAQETEQRGADDGVED